MNVTPSSWPRGMRKTEVLAYRAENFVNDLVRVNAC